MQILIKIVITAVALLVVEWLVPGITIDNFVTALIAAVILGLLNLIARPILVILTLPVTILTLGLFIFVINAALFLLAASFVDGFTVSGFIPALIGSLLVSIFSAMGNKLVTE